MNSSSLEQTFKIQISDNKKTRINTKTKIMAIIRFICWFFIKFQGLIQNHVMVHQFEGLIQNYFMVHQLEVLIQNYFMVYQSKGLNRTISWCTSLRVYNKTLVFTVRYCNLTTHYVPSNLIKTKLFKVFQIYFLPGKFYSHYYL